jgi:hypothetical protein
MNNIAKIRQKYQDHRAIQCICDAFPCETAPIAMRSRAPLKVLGALMWNREVHMVMAGIPEQYHSHRNIDDNEVWKDVIQLAIDCEVFDTDNFVVVKDVCQTPNGLLVWFETPTKRSQDTAFRKRLLKIRRKFAEFDSWGGSVLEPFVP